LLTVLMDSQGGDRGFESLTGYQLPKRPRKGSFQWLLP